MVLCCYAAPAFAYIIHQHLQCNVNICSPSLNMCVCFFRSSTLPLLHERCTSPYNTALVEPNCNYLWWCFDYFFSFQFLLLLFCAWFEQRRRGLNQVKNQAYSICLHGTYIVRSGDQETLDGYSSIQHLMCAGLCSLSLSLCLFSVRACTPFSIHFAVSRASV